MRDEKINPGSRGEMITAGVDAGNKFTKVVVVQNGEMISNYRIPSGFNPQLAAREAFNRALDLTGLSKNALQGVVATGTGKAEVDFAGSTVTEISAAARGIRQVVSEAYTVVDVGAEEGRVLKMDETGRVINFTISDKCAAGAGSFVEMMSQALEVTPAEMGFLSLQATQTVPMNAQCAVFAESEVISLIHARIPRADIARSVLQAMASRISAMVRRVGLSRELAMIGGLAKNPGFVRELEIDLGTNVFLPENPDLVSALGAALIAAEKIADPNKN